MSHSTVLSAGIVEGLLHRAVLPPHPRCLACVAGSEPTIKAGFIVPQLPEPSADSPSLDADGTDVIVSVIRCVPLFGQNMIGMRARLLPLLCAAIRLRSDLFAPCVHATSRSSCGADMALAKLRCPADNNTAPSKCGVGYRGYVTRARHGVHRAPRAKIGDTFL